MIRFLPTALIVLVFAPIASAGVVSLTTTGPGLTLDEVVVNRDGTNYTYQLSDLTGVTLTAFDGASGSVILTQDGGPLPPTGSRATLIEDARFDTGIINPDRSATAMSFDLASPLVNVAGVDLIMFEIDPASEGGDDFLVRINGITNTISPDINTGVITPSSDVYEASTTITTLTQLEDNPSFTSSSGNIDQPVFAYSLDLSDFGISLGDSITSFEFGSVASGDTVDPVFVAGLPIPEPGSILLLLAGSSLIMGRRRRQR